MATALKFGLDEDVYDLAGQRVANHVRTQGEDVAIGVLSRSAGGPGVAAERRASAAHLVGRDADTDAVGTDHNAELVLTVDDGLCERRGDVRVVGWLAGGGAEISNLMPLAG